MIIWPYHSPSLDQLGQIEKVIEIEIVLGLGSTMALVRYFNVHISSMPDLQQRSTSQCIMTSMTPDSGTCFQDASGLTTVCSWKYQQRLQRILDIRLPTSPRDLTKVPTCSRFLAFHLTSHFGVFSMANAKVTKRSGNMRKRGHRKCDTAGRAI